MHLCKNIGKTYTNKLTALSLTKKISDNSECYVHLYTSILFRTKTLMIINIHDHDFIHDLNDSVHNDNQTIHDHNYIPFRISMISLIIIIISFMIIIITTMITNILFIIPLIIIIVIIITIDLNHLIHPQPSHS